MNGGVRCAASPRRKTRPDRKAGGQPGAEGVGGAAGDLHPGQVIAVRPWPQQGAERVLGDQVVLVLAFAQLELPPVPVPGDLHERGRPGGVADLLDAVPGLQPAGDPDVDDEPALGEAEVLHRQARQVPDRAPGAVAAQDQAAGERALLAGWARSGP